MVKKKGEPDLMIFAVKMSDVFIDEGAESIGNSKCFLVENLGKYNVYPHSC